MSISVVFIGGLASCGKQLAQKSDEPKRGNRNSRGVETSSDIEDFLSKQKLYCGEKSCPDNLTKIVVFYQGKVKFCTGTLIGNDIVVTTASCLPSNYRVPNLKCSDNVHFFFNLNGSTQRFNCARVISSSTNDGDDPALWKHDHIFFKLQESVPTKPVQISKYGFVENLKYDMWKLDFFDSYQAEIKNEKCIPFYNSYANPFVLAPQSSMMTLEGCSNKTGTGGAPLFNVFGKFVGMMSGSLQTKVKSFVEENDLLKENLGSIIHASNMACVITPNDPWNMKLSEDCQTRTDVYSRDRARYRILNETKIHQENMNYITSEVKRLSKYFNFEVKFLTRQVQRGAGKWPQIETYPAEPNCIHSPNQWFKFNHKTQSVVSEFPNWVLQMKFNKRLQPESTFDVDELGKSKPYEFIFSPKNWQKYGSTYVTLNYHLAGQEETQTYYSVNKICSQNY